MRPALRFSLSLFLLLAAALRAQQPWTPATSPTTQNLWGVCWGNSQFVAVGEGGTILTSPDGTIWTARTSGTNRWLLDAAWSPDLRLYAAVGDAGTLLTSPDAINWTSRASNTAQRLNSIAWGAGVFLAVGEAGAAVSSPNGLTWTPRTTGAAGWLRGLAFGKGLFVVTGQDATLLTTGDGGITFVRRSIATSLGLDAAVFTGERFYTVGGDLTLGSSSDGASWSIDQNLNADGSEDGITYNGLAFFNNSLVIVGDLGRIRDGFGFPWSLEPWSTSWRAVAAGSAIPQISSRVVTVGTGGTIASAPLDANASHSAEIILSGNPYLGGSVVLQARARGATPLAYSWSFNGQTIPTATGPTLTLNSLTSAQIGTYGAIVTFADGPSTASVYVSPQPNPPTLGLMDTTFRPLLVGPPSAVLPLTDGRVYLASPQTYFVVGGGLQRGVARLNADGSVDPTFNVGSGLGLEGKVSSLIVQPDGRLVLYGSFRTINGVFQPKLARLNADGSLDTTFQPDASLRDSINSPILLIEGRWLTATARKDVVGNRIVTVARFRSNGSADPDFAPFDLAASGPAPALESSTAILAATDSQGRIFLAAHYGYPSYNGVSADNDRSLLFRLNADGTHDSRFAPRIFNELRVLQASARGLICQDTTWHFS